MTDARQVGDWRTPEISISTDAGLPAAGTVTLSVTRGDDTVIASVVMTAGTPTATATPWTGAAYELTVPGEWVERFTITGDGKGKAEQRFWVESIIGTVPTGMRMYATTKDYADSPLTSAPDASLDVRKALLIASARVDEMLNGAIYETNSTTLLPTDAAVTVALRDATVAQAAYAVEIGDPYGVGASQYQSVTIGGVSLGASYTSAGGSTPGRYSPAAFDILRAAGLTGMTPLPYAWSGGVW